MFHKPKEKEIRKDGETRFLQKPDNFDRVLDQASVLDPLALTSSQRFIESGSHHDKLRWESASKLVAGSNKSILSDPAGKVLVVLAHPCRVSMLNSSVFLIWFQDSSRDNNVSVGPICLVILDANKLAVIEDPPTEIKKMDVGRVHVLHKGGLIGSCQISADLPFGIHRFEFPEVLGSVNEGTLHKGTRH